MKKLYIFFLTILMIPFSQLAAQYMSKAEAIARQDESNKIALHKQKLKADLIVAVEAGDANKVKALLEQGADPSIETKWTEERYADVAKNPEVRRLLKDAINKPKKELEPQPRIPAQVVQPSAPARRPLPTPGSRPLPKPAAQAPLPLPQPKARPLPTPPVYK